MQRRFTLPEARYLGSILEYLRLTINYSQTLKLSFQEISDDVLRSLAETISASGEIGVDRNLMRKIKKLQKNLSKLPPETELSESMITSSLQLLKDLQMDVDRQLVRIEQETTPSP